jgi:hypothetical protein
LQRYYLGPIAGAAAVLRFVLASSQPSLDVDLASLGKQALAVVRELPESNDSMPLIWNDQSMHHRFFLVGSSLSSLTQRVETAEGRTRRLITLIFADRHNAAVMVVIRRELPQTRLADWFD